MLRLYQLFLCGLDYMSGKVQYGVAALKSAVLSVESGLAETASEVLLLLSNFSLWRLNLQ